MTVLSEATIKAHMAAGKLIANGDLAHVRGSTYSCHAAKVFLGGPGSQNGQPLWYDWETPKPTDVYRIQPRQVVWVRIRETVALPNNVCAFWWQTNTLSRNGLMLVNMSMVDAGYEGSLACLFVNFGREPVDIDPKTTVARLIFHMLDADNVPYGPGDSQQAYDAQLRKVALSGPSSFLSFQEFSQAFQDERKRALEEFKADEQKFQDERKKALEEFKADARSSGLEIRKSYDTLITGDITAFLKKSSMYAVAGLGLLTLAISFAPWVSDRLSLDVDKNIASTVEREIGKRLQPISMLDSVRTQGLEQRLQSLEAAIKALGQTSQGQTGTGR